MRTAIPTPSCINVDNTYIYVNIVCIGCGDDFEIRNIMYKDVDLFDINLMSFAEIAEAKHRARYQYLLERD
tara:strand:+ start:1610 stop:1822 length:213 start_codon:yes stop_codon:yes gene_type:complete